MIVLQILSLFFWLALVPFGIGLILLRWMSVRMKTCSVAFVTGYIVEFMLLEIVGIPVVLLSNYHGYSNLMKLYLPILVLTSIAGYLLTILDHRKGRVTFSLRGYEQRIKQRRSWGNIVLLVLFVLLILFQMYMAFTRASFDGDDAYYGVQALTAQQTDTLYRINPNNGRSAPLDARHALALFPIFEAMMGTMSGIHATIMCHTVIPLLLIPLTYLLYFVIARKLFAKKAELVPMFLALLALWQMFGNVSIFTTETFFLTRTWQGKSFAGNFIIPAVIWLFLTIYEQTDEKEDRRVFWLLLTALNLAGGASSSLAILLSCCLTVGFGFLFTIRDKKLKPLLYSCCSCLCGGAYVLLYLLL